MTIDGHYMQGNTTLYAGTLYAPSSSYGVNFAKTFRHRKWSVKMIQFANKQDKICKCETGITNKQKTICKCETASIHVMCLLDFWHWFSTMCQKYFMIRTVSFQCCRWRFGVQIERPWTKENTRHTSKQSKLECFSFRQSTVF